MRTVDNVVLVDGKVSTSLTAQFHLQIGNNILFCGEGDATLAAATLQEHPPLLVARTPRRPTRFHPETDWTGTYEDLLRKVSLGKIRDGEAAAKI